MTEIPADVMKAATDIACSAERGVPVGSLPGVIYLAKAILAERERCANIAHCGCMDPMCNRCGVDDAIREGK